MKLEDLLSYLISPPPSEILLILKILFSVFSLTLLFIIIYFLLKTDWLRKIFLQDAIEFLIFRPYGIKKYFKVWLKILKRMEKNLEEEAKLAIIEADDLLNEVLEMMGYKGESLGERIKQVTEALLPNLDEISKVHQTRNNIVHDPTYRLNFDEAKRILKIYEQALQDLDAI